MRQHDIPVHNMTKCATPGCRHHATAPLLYCAACCLKREREANRIYDLALAYAKQGMPWREAWAKATQGS